MAAEIMVFQFLSLGRGSAKQGAASVNQVFSLLIHLFINEEIFLFRSHGRYHPGGIGTKQLQYTKSLFVDGFHRTKQRGLFVQRFAGVRAERSGNAKGVLLDERIRRGVPSGVAPSLKGSPQAAGGKGRCVRFTPNQFFAREVQQHPAAFYRVDEAVVLFSGDAGHRLEPVGKMGAALFN